VDEAGVPR
ncbi:hypothetical protein SOVF_187990, partial [Spinacia oleracea]